MPRLTIMCLREPLPRLLYQMYTFNLHPNPNYYIKFKNFPVDHQPHLQNLIKNQQINNNLPCALILLLIIACIQHT